MACTGESPNSTFSFPAGEGGSENSADSDEGGDSSDGDDSNVEISIQEESGESGESGESEDGSSIKFDTPFPDVPASEASCGVDILFVIDNSGSMGQHKESIAEAFDNFIAEMVAALEFGTPVHIAVTRATGFFDPGNGSGWTDPGCNFGFLDGTWNPPTLSNNGNNGQQGRLYEHQGKRFTQLVIGEDSTQVEAWFEGALYGAIALDDSSNSESVVAGAAYPFHPVNADYNAGFLRDKAVLVLFLISDAPDASPAQIATSDFITMVSNAKSECGDACVLPTGVVQALCYGGEENVNTRLYDFMNGFGGPPADIDFFKASEPPESFSSALGGTLAQAIANTCDLIAE